MAGSGDPSEPGTEPVAARTLLADRRLVSILLLSGVGVFGTQLIPPVLPAIQSGLGVSDARIGLVMTALFLPAFVLIPVVGAVSDIYGRRRVALISLAGFGLAGVGGFFAPSFEVLLALRVVQGICFAPLTPLSVAYVGDFFSGYAGTTAQGIRVSTNGLVIIAAPAAAGILAELAWNVPFLVYAVAFPAIVFVYWHFPEPASDDDDAPESVRRELRVWLRGVGGALLERNLQVLVLGGFVLFGVRIVMFTVAPLLGTRVIGLGVSVVGVLFSLFGVVRIVVAPQAGRVAAVLSRKTAFLATMTVVAASMGLFAVASTLPGFVAAILAFSVGMSLFNPTLNDAVTASASAAQRAGVVSAMQSAKNVANTAGPALAGLLLAATDFRTVFGVAAVLAVGYLLVLAALLDRTAG
jgi:MFS family permease